MSSNPSINKKIKPIDISKISPSLMKLLNENPKEIIMNPKELKYAIKEKELLSKLISPITLGNKTKKMELTKEEKRTLYKLKTPNEIEDEKDKETEYYTALTEKGLYSSSTSGDTLRKKINRILTKKISNEKLKHYINSKKSKKGGQKTMKRRTKI
jgi:hypothetical protein